MPRPIFGTEYRSFIHFLANPLQKERAREKEERITYRSSLLKSSNPDDERTRTQHLGGIGLKKEPCLRLTQTNACGRCLTPSKGRARTPKELGRMVKKCGWVFEVYTCTMDNV